MYIECYHSISACLLLNGQFPCGDQRCSRARDESKALQRREDLFREVPGKIGQKSLGHFLARYCKHAFVLIEGVWNYRQRVRILCPWFRRHWTGYCLMRRLGKPDDVRGYVGFEGIRKVSSTSWNSTIYPPFFQLYFLLRLKMREICR